MLWFLNMLLSGKWSNLKPLNGAWHLVWSTGSCFLVLFWRNSPNDSIQSHLQTCLVLHHKKGRSNIKPETQSLAKVKKRKVKKESFFWNLSHTPDESSVTTPFCSNSSFVSPRHFMHSTPFNRATLAALRENPEQGQGKDIEGAQGIPL